MKVTSPFDYEGELILVEVKLSGPRGRLFVWGGAYTPLLGGLWTPEP
jgi:hypothetical protein